MAEEEEVYYTPYSTAASPVTPLSVTRTPYDAERAELGNEPAASQYGLLAGITLRALSW